MFINLAVHSLHLSDRLDLAHDEETERFKVVRIKAGYSEEQGRIEFDNGFVFAHESNLKKDEKPVGCELSVLVAHTDKRCCQTNSNQSLFAAEGRNLC